MGVRDPFTSPLGREFAGGKGCRENVELHKKNSWGGLCLLSRPHYSVLPSLIQAVPSEKLPLCSKNYTDICGSTGHGAF